MEFTDLKTLSLLLVHLSVKAREEGVFQGQTKAARRTCSNDVFREDG